MKKATKILIVGVGSIGIRHINNLIGLDYSNVAICDFDESKMKRLEGLGKLPKYTDVKKAFQVEKPRVVLICTPPSSHITLADVALDNKCDVFIEKPLSNNLEGVASLIKRARELKRTVMVACNWRYNRGLLALKKILESGSFGKILYADIKVVYYLPGSREGSDYRKIYAANRSEGGVILDSGSHVLDYLIDLFGDVVHGASIVSNLHPLKIEAEELAKLILRHKNGVISSVALDYVSQKPIHRLEVVCNKGLLSLDFREELLSFENDTEKKILYKGSGDLNRMFIDEINDFLKKAEKRERPIQDLGDAKKRMEILLKLKNEWQVKS